VKRTGRAEACKPDASMATEAMNEAFMMDCVICLKLLYLLDRGKQSVMMIQNNRHRTTVSFIDAKKEHKLALYVMISPQSSSPAS
jgi:hypothetical protein